MPARTIREVQEATARAFGISRKEMLGPSRRRALSRPRRVAMYLARRLSGKTYQQLGNAFGRHHSTIIAAVEEIPAEMSVLPLLRAQVDQLYRELAGEA